MDPNTILLLIGAALIAVGIIGGGLSLKEVQVPRVGTLPRILLFVVGTGFVIMGTGLIPKAKQADSDANRARPVPAPLVSQDLPKAASTDRPAMPAHPPAFRNLALYGKASQSSTDHEGEASRAIDGKTTGDYFRKSVTHTREDLNASWWKVELDNPATISKIMIFNRTDCCPDRLSEFRVSLLHEAREVFSREVSDPVSADAPLEIDVPPGTRAQVVRIQLKGLNRTGTSVLSLAEVQVFGHE